MPLSEERFEAVSQMLAVIEPDIKHLTDWQQGFIRDQIKRHKEYGQDMHLSDKQLVQIKKAYKDVAGSEFGEEEPPPADRPKSGSESRGRFGDDLDDEIPF